MAQRSISPSGFRKKTVSKTIQSSQTYSQIGMALFYRSVAVATRANNGDLELPTKLGNVGKQIASLARLRLSKSISM